MQVAIKVMDKICVDFWSKVRALVFTHTFDSGYLRLHFDKRVITDHELTYIYI